MLRALAIFLILALAAPLSGQEASPKEQESEGGATPIVQDDIEVKAAYSGDLPLEGGSAITIIPEDSLGEQHNLADVVSQAPGVAESGQGGLFQVFSIRGLSKHRVQTLISGVRLAGDRRAGVAVSLLDPLLMGRVEVVRGASSTLFGSGALGGVIRLTPRQDETTRFQGGYRSEGNEWNLAAYRGTPNLQWGLAHRQASSGETAKGEERHSGFSQSSAFFRRRWDWRGFGVDLLALGALGRDIEKDSADFPKKSITDYPRDEHWLGRIRLDHRDRWWAQFAVHSQHRRTEVERLGQSMTEAESQSLDLAGALHWSKLLGDHSLLLGADSFQRLGVRAEETVLDQGQLSSSFRRSLEGSESEWAVFSVDEWRTERLTWVGGLRGTYYRQSQESAESYRDSALTGYTGLSFQWSPRFSLHAQVGTGLRFPSLSERFFRGVTGRGSLKGNRDLEPERSLDFHFGARWGLGNLFITVDTFRMEIDDFIERIEESEDRFTFQNLTQGTLEGIELEAIWQLGEAWRLTGTAHRLRGRRSGGGFLADVPADRLSLQASWRYRELTTDLRWEERFTKDEVGPGEREIPQAHLVDARLSWAIDERWNLSLRGQNLLNEEYFRSADDKATLAPGRSFGLSASISL